MTEPNPETAKIDFHILLDSVVLLSTGQRIPTGYAEAIEKIADEHDYDMNIMAPDGAAALYR